MKIVGLCSLYEPLKFLKNKIQNLNSCNTKDLVVYFADCSSENTFKEIFNIIKSEANFQYSIYHFPNRTTLYYTWNWIIKNMENQCSYFTNINVDDIYDPNYFDKMSQFLDIHPQYKLISCSWIVTKELQQWPPKQQDGTVQPDPYKTMGHFPMWRSSLHKEIGYFDDRMVAIGDAYFWTKIIKKFTHKALGVHPETLACYLSHSNNLYYIAKGPHGENGEQWDRSIGDK